MSALQQQGLSEVWDVLGEFRSKMEETGELEHKREQQKLLWMWAHVEHEVMRRSVQGLVCHFCCVMVIFGDQFVTIKPPSVHYTHNLYTPQPVHYKHNLYRSLHVHTTTCTQYHLYTSPVHTTACTHHHLYTPPPVHITCTHYHLYTPPPVHSQPCTQQTLYTPPPVYTTCTHHHLYTSPVHTTTCTHHLYTPPPVHTTTCTQQTLYTANPVHTCTGHMHSLFLSFRLRKQPFLLKNLEEQVTKGALSPRTAAEACIEKLLA